ncbi:mevalonate kinase [Lewinella marina]|uniref:mevalonate kinase n=1 Tax=Neolewinella marina TaxID=438751 RepID=A0A2G0CDW2_9BACT|nr:hypothetical protein [Neolewinella marina]NJB87531.1 mevalonate kinase [Neolewinella marina]PHK98163.1 hypothetical protein CGL56_10680 [Neolewinella marina]
MTDELATGRTYPAKVLLYGEHTLLRGGRGLAVPYPRYALRWATGDPDPRLASFADFLGESVADLIDADRFREEVSDGLRLAGNIPTGYGLGSSGAVCAAVWDRYARPGVDRDRPTRKLRADLARLEAYFHGSSSGTDPLISFLNHPLLLSGGGNAGAVKLPAGWARGFFLIDTGMERSAAPLINRFLEAYARAPEPIREGWQAPADRAIEALIQGDREGLYRATARISGFQRLHFSHFIPEAWRDRWNGGENYRLKLCGAGGGGMVLGLARDPEATGRALGEELDWLG